MSSEDRSPWGPHGSRCLALPPRGHGHVVWRRDRATRNNVKKARNGSMRRCGGSEESPHVGPGRARRPSGLVLHLGLAWAPVS